jgi:hypothetical protein
MKGNKMRRYLAKALAFLMLALAPLPVTATQFPYPGTGSFASVCSAEMEPNLCLGTFIQGILNPLSAGQVAGLSAATTPAATTITTILSYQLPQGILTSGKALRTTMWGTNTATGNNTFTLSFGATNAAVTVSTATAGVWKVNCEIINVGTVASPSQNIDCRGTSGATGTTVLPATQVNGTNNITTGGSTAVLLQTTGSSASNTTTLGAYIEIVQ